MVRAGAGDDTPTAAAGEAGRRVLKSGNSAGIPVATGRTAEL